MGLLEKNKKGILALVEKDLVSRLNKINLERVAKNALNLMDDRKNKVTKNYRSPIKGKPKFIPYSEKYAKRKDVSINSVNLRSKGSRSIEETTVKTVGIKSSNSRSGIAFLKWRDKKKGLIFGWHQTGEATGGKVRKVFPEKNREVPKEVTELVIDTLTAEILSQTVR